MAVVDDFPMLRFGLSARESEVLLWIGGGSIPMAIAFGADGFIAMLSVASWAMPGWSKPIYRTSTGKLLDDFVIQINHGLLAYPIFLWWALHADPRAFAILPLAAALASCYIITWYFTGSEDAERRRCCGFIWACALAFLLG